jgi:bacillithiol synthase
MKLQNIDFEETGRFSSLFLDYIHNKKDLSKHFAHLPQISSFKDAIAKKKFDTIKRNVLVNVLKDQYKEVAMAPLLLQNIESLKDENTFTVTTGHQLNIFTGPLFFIYKIVAAINMAKQLNEAYPDYHFVPVYWMASEDHDFEEINHFNLFGKKYVWETEQSGPVGKFDCTSLKSVLEELPECPDFFSKGYLEQDNLAEATRYIVNHLFGSEGLIVLDADNKELKNEFTDIIRRDIIENASHEHAQKCSESLEKLGYKCQIYPRPVNFFYSIPSLRERIEFQDGSYRVLNTSLSFTKGEIETLIRESPEKFSPNVVLRPVYQEIILPNLAYIGGPAEVSYWFQLKDVFDAYSVPFPVLFPRAFAVIISKTIAKKMDKLGLNPTEVFGDYNALKEKVLFQDADPSYDLSEQLSTIESAFKSIQSVASEVDQSLEGFVISEYKKTEKAVDNIQKRLKKAEEQKEAVTLKQLESVLDKLFPGGNPQEREDNFLNFYINNPKFIDELLQLLDPFNLKYNILSEDV